MTGFCYSVDGSKYNVIIMAAGMGSRMGEQSNFLPKALTPLGNQRAIDYIIERYLPIAHKIIIQVGWQHDILVNYVQGKWRRHLDSIIEFSYGIEEGMSQSNARSATLALDHADSRYPTLITFCDLLMMGNFDIESNTLYYATKDTKGHLGTFRHGIEFYEEMFDTGATMAYEIKKHKKPSSLSEVPNGLVGLFIFKDTPSLKEIAYGAWGGAKDLTEDIVEPYVLRNQPVYTKECSSIFEFGTQDDIAIVRKMWEEA